MVDRRRLADKFFASSRLGIGRQLAIAAAIILVAAAIVGIDAGSDKAGTPSPTTVATIRPLAGLDTAVTTSTEPSVTVAPTPAAVTTVPPTQLSVTTAALTTTSVEVEAATRAPVATPAGSVDALALLATIPVELEHRGGYSRDLFAVWSDLDGDGCDTRAEVLIAESLTPAQVDASGCGVVAGDWLSSYDGTVITSPGDLDIDHVVPLKEAWDSGAWQWSADQRIEYANDTTDPRTLAAVSATSNRSKGDKDPSNWLPPDTNDVCTYLGDWVAIKARWGLSMDQSEWGRIKNVLTASCPGLRVEGTIPA